MASMNDYKGAPTKGWQKWVYLAMTLFVIILTIISFKQKGSL